MELLLSKPRGFCAGVERAIQVVEKALSLWGAPIYVKHEIVHNRHVVSRLRDKGAIFIEDLDEVPEGSRLIYSAHGIAPSVREQAKKRRLIEIDATCVLVTKVHSAVKRYAKMGYQILLIGHKNHVEVQGTLGEAPEHTTIIETPFDVERLSLTSLDTIFYTCQTTLSLDEVTPIIEAILKKYPHAETLPSSSICYATTNRQEALKALVPHVDLILVVGDPTSSNSNRLNEVGPHRQVTSYLINSPEMIQERWLLGVKRVALTAGASTPEDVVQSCVQRLKELGVSSVREEIFVEEDIVFQLPRELK